MTAPADPSNHEGRGRTTDYVCRGSLRTELGRQAYLGAYSDGPAGLSGQQQAAIRERQKERGERRASVVLPHSVVLSSGIWHLASGIWRLASGLVSEVTSEAGTRWGLPAVFVSQAHQPARHGTRSFIVGATIAMQHAREQGASCKCNADDVWQQGTGPGT